MRLWTAATIIAVAIVVGFALSVPRAQDVPPPKALAVSSSTPPIVLHDAFKRGTHTITGTITVPNACTEVAVAASLLDSASSSPSILVAFSLPEDTEVCLQVPTPVRFSATVVAPAGLPIMATVNNNAATTSAL